MKTKKLIAMLLCLATVLVITAACSKDEEEEPVVLYETNVFGETVTNEKGEPVTVDVVGTTVEYVTNSDGKVVVDSGTGEQQTIIHYYVTEVDDKGNVVTNANKEPVTKHHSSSGGSEVIETTTVEVETLPEGTVVEENKKLLEKAFSSGKFYIDMSVENPIGIPMGMTFATNGTDVYYCMSVNALNILKFNVAGLMTGGKAYVIDNESKTYCETQAAGTAEEMEDMMGALVVDTDANYIQTTIVTSKGKTYICEEYATEYGSSKYYFDQTTEELKRIEHDNSDVGNVVIVNKFIKDPDSSYFQLPGGYKKITEEEFNSNFEDMMGAFGSLGM
ncbi:MAG: hypothetical protein E7536_00620 [Ruminococcaceae bacterium]|nr:hypothetical protein [Oscillospiraceae bacterium]